MPKKTLKEINKKYPRRNGIYYRDTEEGLKKYISITKALESIAKPQLIPWAARGAARHALNNPTLTEQQAAGMIYGERDTKAAIGTTVHSLLEALEQGASIDLKSTPPKYRGYAESYNKFSDTWKPEVVHFNGEPLRETLVYSDKYGIAGRVDTCLKLHDGRQGVVDWKTGGVYAEAALQGEAYKVCLEEMGFKVDFTATAKLHEDGTSATFQENTKGDFRAFLAALYLTKWLNPELRRIYEE